VGGWALVGDRVEVRSFEEIQKTLDENGLSRRSAVMPEMAAFCNRPAWVFGASTRSTTLGEASGCGDFVTSYSSVAFGATEAPMGRARRRAICCGRGPGSKTCGTAPRRPAIGARPWPRPRPGSSASRRSSRLDIRVSTLGWRLRRRPCGPGTSARICGRSWPAM